MLQGFKGQSRVIIPRKTSCYECSLDMLTKKTTFPICTIANTPRLPEHCIEWASAVEWPRLFPGMILLWNVANCYTSAGLLRCRTEPYVGFPLIPVFIRSHLMVERRLDTDNPEHVKWTYDVALERAQHFGIAGVTNTLTMGVIKNIIPAIAATNAIIAGNL